MYGNVGTIVKHHRVKNYESAWNRELQPSGGLLTVFCFKNRLMDWIP